MGWQDAPVVNTPGSGPAPAWQNAPEVDPMLNAVAKGVKNQGRINPQELLLGESFQHHAPAPQKLGRLPFTHQAILAMMDNPDERKAFLEKEYGAGSVSQDKHGLIVKGKDGKPLRASSSFLASLVAEAPETTLGIAGAAEGAGIGAAAGPAGAFAGAVGGAATGAAAGKTLKEGAKAVTGTYRKTAGQYTASVAGAMEGGAEGEIAGRGANKVLGRLTRGPLPGLITGATPESKAMTERVLAGGARPGPQSTMPDARKLQRIAIIADKLSGPSHAIDRANRGYLQDQADRILTRAGLNRTAKTATMKSMEGTDAALSSQQTGQMVQNGAKSFLAAVKASNLKPAGPTLKAVEYARKLAAPGMTPENAYNLLVHGGQTDMLEKTLTAFGKNSPITQAVQQQALRHAFIGAMEETSENAGMTGLSKWMGQFTEKQQKLLFPNGLADDMKLLDKEIKFLYPAVKDPSVAGFTTGSMMQKKFYERWYHQGVGALYRSFLQQPAVIRRLAVGFRGNSMQRTAAKTGLREMFYFGALEMSEPQQQEQPQR